MGAKTPKDTSRQLVLLVDSPKQAEPSISPIEEPAQTTTHTALRMDAAALDARLRALVPADRITAVAARLLEATVPLHASSGGTEASPEEALPEGWPVDVSAQSLLNWLESTAPNKTFATQLKDAVRASPRFAFTTEPLPVFPVGISDEDLLFAAWTCHAWQAVERDRRRPAIAIDAGKPHHDMLTLHRRQPKSKRSATAYVMEHRYVIRMPDIDTRLAIPRNEPHTALLEAFKDWKEWHGLRIWAALLWLASKAGRTGFLRWRLVDHLAALGYSERMRRDPKLRARLLAEVGVLTQTFIEVYDSSGRLQLKDTILRVGIQASILRGGNWELEGMELQISPILYRGVRQYDSNNKPGELGVLWYPAPIELAQIDAERYPHTLALGFILPIRWRWDLGERDHLALQGKNLIELAGVPIYDGNTSRAMDTLKRNLDELIRIGGLKRYDWLGGEDWSMGGICRLYPPAWTVDRTVHGIPPLELPQPSSPKTGAELEAWRKARELTQVQLAQQLNVSPRTIIRAEGRPGSPLTPQLSKAIQGFSTDVTDPGDGVG